ncbi:FitA-like ribbon-helix-helix domain-containing protein [Serinicoccus marinus]|uniref:FitA-like ribbon-helix-helix domain-containing protein n=1 Tax=Serinicoccus marinus TaxID=247333 RepID=UPI002492914B|nr:hypothetical protein [Serinicoccus marinus]
MEQILIRGLPAGTKAALRKRAEQNHRSAEAEARDALTRALRDEPVTIAEIERGVIAKERADPRQGEVLRRWFEDHVVPAFAGRVLAFDLAAARILAGYRVPERCQSVRRGLRYAQGLAGRPQRQTA